MADSERNQGQQPSYTPASFEKRTAAWMGIAYVLMLLFLITFIFAPKHGLLASRRRAREAAC